MASASWCKETDEKINYTKLCRLLVDGGTQAVRSVFDGIHPPSSLKAILNTNKTTLQKLKKPKGKVLNNEQWDQLYPPSGTDPKSVDFDITLLFVILRNICGLTAPATGWDASPPVTDTSKEANLARIKYYRNNAIAHKPSTEICDADFEQHWQDISSVLVSLGLSQDDIDDLKSAPLGKKDYNQLLDDWYVSDQDIKTQLEDVKSVTTDLKSDTADLKSDTADIKSDAADIKSYTAALKSDTTDLKSDTADLKSDTESIKSDTANLKSDTADIKSDTADIKSDTADIKSDTADIKSDTADIKSDTADLKSVTADVKNKVDEIATGMRKTGLQIQKLAVSDFRSEIQAKCKSFHPNTRQWILDQVKSHVDGHQPASCIMLITGGPGMGKSTLAAKICQTYKHLGCLAGCHFFQFSNSTRNNPRLMLQSISRQMYDTFPVYGEALERKLQTNLGKTISELNCEELLTILIEEPLCNVKHPNSNLAVVIDALDECSHDARDELLKALKKKLPCFPPWLRFIITSRPSTNTSALGSTVAVEIKPEDQSNTKDLESYFDGELKALYQQCQDYDNVDLVQKLVEMTKGLFLVAYFVIDYLKKENVESPENVLKLFPNGISSVYDNYFSRLKDVLLPYISEEERFYKMLEAVAATKDPLPKNMFYNILGLKGEREVPRQERKGRRDALNTLHCLFPVEGDHVTAFHKSVFDWLTLEDEEHDFSVLVEDGDEVLVSQCNDVLCDIMNGKKDLNKPLNLTDSEKYAVSFLCHLVYRRSSIAKDDKYGFFSNLYLLTTLSLEGVNFASCLSDSDGILPGSLLNAIRCFRKWLPIIKHYEPSCQFFGVVTSFEHYLAFFLQTAHAKGVSEETVPKPLDALEKYLFPYYCEDTLLERPFVVVKQLNGHFPILSPSFQYLLKSKEGFIAVLPASWSNSLHTAVFVFRVDGCPIGGKRFLGKKLIRTSPNINFIVAVEENGKKIEILDVTTLDVVREYDSPHDAIETCHVFGDDQGFFIIIKGCHSDKVYVIEGLTGQVHNTITVTEDSTVMDVSSRGHILVTRTWERHEPERMNSFTNSDGEVEVMNWRKQHAEYESSPKPGIQTPSKVYFIYTYREMSLHHYDSEKEPIPIHPLAGRVCCCPYNLPVVNVDEAVCVSEDGCLLAYHYNYSIFIVNTSDGSLFKRCSLDTVVSNVHILFVASSYVMIMDDSLFVINIQTDEIEHRICLPYSVFPNTKQYLLFLKEDGKSFNLISNHFTRGSYEVSRLVFHHLNLQGLR